MSVTRDRSGRTSPLLGAALIVAAYGGALAVGAERLNLLGREDALIETAGALCFALAAAGFLAAAVAAARQVRAQPDLTFRRPLIYGLLAGLMLVCCGEELSWGQRLVGWQTPRIFAAHNAQGETNLHNLQTVHQWHPDGTEKGFLPKLVNMNRLFSIFWLTVFVVIPAAAAASARLRDRFIAAGLPLPPLWAGGLFLTSYAMYKVLAFAHAGTIRAHALDELKETSYAAIFLALAIVALAAERRGTSAAERRSGTRKEAGTAAC